ncbi:MAG: ABC transporter permease [Defluviitaleaceae bacterium]|nr:ABC transporter permease [Defluviitaleaceae bacterium]
MKNIKHVISFEYMSIVKTKSFIIVLALMMIVAVGASFLPVIIGFFGNVFGGNGEQNGDITADNQVVDIAPGSQIAVIDRTSLFTNDLLLQYMPDGSFVNYTEQDVNFITQAVEEGHYIAGLYFVTPLSFMVIFQNTLAGPQALAWVNQMVVTEYRNQLLAEHNLTQSMLDFIVQLEEVSAQPIFVPVGGLGFAVGYIVNFLIFFPLVFGGSIIAMAVINEKTSKTVELIFTSAKPSVIIVGKVIAATLVIFTQIIAVAGSALLGLRLTNNYLLQLLSPEILAELATPITYLYVGVFFVLAFFTFSFMFAAFAATVRDVQESSSATLIPTMIMLGGFYTGLAISMNTGWLNPLLIDIFSFAPFTSPFAMTIRITAFFVPTHQILLAIGVNVIYTVAVAFLSIKIYKKNIMAYGQKNSFFSLLKAKILKKA